MKHQRHFGTRDAAQREAVKIRKMIADLDRSAQLLNCDIAIEEERTGMFDRSDAAYPMLARMLTARRDNLRETITALEKQLSKQDQAEMVAELAKGKSRRVVPAASSLESPAGEGLERRPRRWGETGAAYQR
jgi:hypothetical protein